MGKIGLITDSSAYLSEKQIRQYDIDVLPISIVWNNKTYQDLIDIGYHEFYEKLATESHLPTTKLLGQFPTRRTLRFKIIVDKVRNKRRFTLAFCSEENHDLAFGV